MNAESVLGHPDRRHSLSPPWLPFLSDDDRKNPTDPFLPSFLTPLEIPPPIQGSQKQSAGHTRAVFRSWFFVAGFLLGGSVLSLFDRMTTTPPGRLTVSPREIYPSDRAYYRWQGYHRMTPVAPPSLPGH